MVATAGGARDVAAVLFFHTGSHHPTNQPLPPEIACSAWPIRRGPTARRDSQQPLRPLPVTQSNTAGATTRVGCTLARLGNLWGSRLDQPCRQRIKPRPPAAGFSRSGLRLRNRNSCGSSQPIKGPPFPI
jgi:hypothetical protein